jgi:hypothetical protein
VAAWSRWSIVFFAYLTVVAEIRPGLTRRTKLRIWAAAAAGAAVAIGAARLPAGGMAAVWILPAAVLLIGYWTSGLTFVRATPSAEAALLAIDRALRISRIAAATPRAVAELLELAYTCVYPLVLFALYFALGAGVSADRFWTVVLITDYICFGMLPWFQTRPPRAFERERPWRSSWRAVNARLLAASSIQVNTFPSGHAAEALAAALLVSGAGLPAVSFMAVAALAVSAGAVLGRYHYAADALAGWAVAIVVYSAF